MNGVCEANAVIYLDNHATTPLAPEALAAMLPFLEGHFANAGSVTHQAGREVAELTNGAIEQIANLLGAAHEELVITSGATESNNLALLGVCLHPRQRRRKVISLVSEHRAVLDPLARLRRHGFQTVLLPVTSDDPDRIGSVDLERMAEEIDDDTAVVSVMLANNEIGTIEPLSQIAGLCRATGALLHTDATQAVGRIPLHVDQLDVDLLSFSAHKFYGPKGIGGLYVRRKGRSVRLQSQIVGGGQQRNLRSGTINSPGIIGMQAALQLCYQNNDWLNAERVESAAELNRIAKLRDRLFDGLATACAGMLLNGPRLHKVSDDEPLNRLPGNLNCSFLPVEGQSLMLAMPDLAVSSGSACTSAEQSTSHVLKAIGCSEDRARSSLRFGIGRYNTEQEIENAVAMVAEAFERLSSLL